MWFFSSQVFNWHELIYLLILFQKDDLSKAILLKDCKTINLY